MLHLSRFARLLLLPLAAVATAGCAGGASSSETDEAALRRQFPDQAALVLGAGRFVSTAAGFARDASSDARGTFDGRGLEIVLPPEGAGRIRFKAPRGLEVQVREVSAEGPGALGEHALVYRRAGGTSYWTVAEGGAEEWLLLDGRAVHRGETLAAWEVEGGLVRQIEDVVEIEDAEGVARLRVTAPAAYAAGGREVAAHLEVRGARIELSVDAEGETVLVDPFWSWTGSMATVRDHQATGLLGSGGVIVAGGETYSSVALSSAELYNPATGTWSSLPAMSNARKYIDHAGAVLGDGRFLVAGGFTVGSLLLKAADVYDPSTNKWWTTGAMATGRDSHTLTWLPSVGKAIAVGGRAVVGGVAGPTSKAELYTPGSGSWSAAGSMTTGRSDHATVMLGSGKLLVTGGNNNLGTTSTAEIYDPATNLWTATAPMGSARYLHTSTWIPSLGKVLVTGGLPGPQPSAELYDPATNTWSAAASMTTNRYAHTATLLSTGKILVAGGHLPGAELYDPATNTWSSAGTNLLERRYFNATLLGNGKVLLAGGESGFNLISNTCEIFELPLGAACTTDADCQSSLCVGGLCTGPTCISIKRGVNGDVYDTQIVSNRPNTNFGGGPATIAGKVGAGLAEPLIEFDLSAIPAGTVFTSATMILRARVGSNGDPWNALNVHSVNGPWSESGVTWSTSPGSSAAVLASTFGGPGVQSFDLTSTAQGWLSGANNGVLLEQPASYYASFYTSEDPAVTNRPELQVCFPCAKVVCTAADQCHTPGVCDPNTAVCSNPNAPDGTACDDGNAGTVNDVCTAGSCAGTPPSGFCVPANGFNWCYNPSQCGEDCTTVCNAVGLTLSPDVNGWFQAQDTVPECQAIADAFGLFTPVYMDASLVGCLKAESAPGGGISGQVQCSTNPDCPANHAGEGDGILVCGPDHYRGICPCELVAACAGVVCAPPGQCQYTGICDPNTGACSYATSPDGYGCDDGDPATSNDQCTAGVCAGM